MIYITNSQNDSMVSLDDFGKKALYSTNISESKPETQLIKDLD